MFSLFKKFGGSESQRRQTEGYRYCPRCDGEYRAEISVCAGCQVPLVAHRRDPEPGVRAGEPVAISPDEEVVTVQRGRLMDIKLQQRRFEREGIASVIGGEGPGGGGSCCRTSGFELQVRTVEAAAAQRLLEQEFRRSTGLEEQTLAEVATTIIDPTAATVRCPACAHHFTPEGDCCPECGLCF